jgi:hypothetical protein
MAEVSTGSRRGTVSGEDALAVSGSGSGASGSGAAYPPASSRRPTGGGSDSGKRLAASMGGFAKSVGGGMSKVGTGAAKGAVSGLTSGLQGFMSSGRGFREFLLKGPVVELAVAVVVGWVARLRRGGACCGTILDWPCSN